MGQVKNKRLPGVVNTEHARQPVREFFLPLSHRRIGRADVEVTRDERERLVEDAHLRMG